MPINTTLNLPYQPDGTVAPKRESALRLIEQLLELRDVIAVHQKEMLSIALWKWTEAEGVATRPKYRIRLRSAGAIDVAVPSSVNHEHVWPRKWLIEQLLAGTPWDRDALREFLDRYAVACIVTVAEHAVLGGTNALGWKRYRFAGVEVYDMLTGEPFVFPTDREADEALPDDEGAPDIELAEETGTDVDTWSVAGGIRHVSAEEAIRLRAGDRADAFRALLDRFDESSLVPVPAMRRGSDTEIGDYLRLHDTRLEEPTPAVAYLHWSGKLSLRLRPDDLPRAHRYGIAPQNHKAYGLRFEVQDHSDVPAAVELVSLALEKVREL